MNLKNSCESFEDRITHLFEVFRSGIAEREDSRAFGAMIEKRITKNWDIICKEMGFIAVDQPGRRSIFDFACKVDSTFFGFDVKTKDLDTKRYSDGGVCAVGNLLKYLANDKGVFVIAEFGHNSSSDKIDARDIEYIRIAPLHVLPRDCYRIENLGTGQVRLNYTVNQVWNEIEWERPYKDFFEMFCELALVHYSRVKADADARIKSIEDFRNNNYEYFRFTKR